MLSSWASGQMEVDTQRCSEDRKKHNGRSVSETARADVKQPDIKPASKLTRAWRVATFGIPCQDSPTSPTVHLAARKS